MENIFPIPSIVQNTGKLTAWYIVDGAHLTQKAVLDPYSYQLGELVENHKHNFFLVVVKYDGHIDYCSECKFVTDAQAVVSSWVSNRIEVEKFTTDESNFVCIVVAKNDIEGCMLARWAWFKKIENGDWLSPLDTLQIV